MTVETLKANSFKPCGQYRVLIKFGGIPYYQQVFHCAKESQLIEWLLKNVKPGDRYVIATSITNIWL